MSKKAKATYTHNEILKEIKKLIRCGLNVDVIIHTMQNQIPHDVMNHSILADLIEDTVNNFPNYNLIQKIMRSKLINDMDDKADKYYIVDPECTEVATISSINAKSMFLRPDFSDKTYLATFEYNPYELKKLYKNGELWKYNTFEPPFWMIDHFHNGKSIKKSELPPMYDKFLSYLTGGDKASYNYILDWLATSIKSRNYCILATIGNQGIGKGVLGTIMEKLVGVHNYTLTDNRLITKEFNAQILNKRLVYIDEFKVNNSKEENRLKLLINDMVEVEKKGIDSKNVDNYASIYVSSNDFDSIRLRGDDRRFSIVKLTDKKLINSLNGSQIQELFLDHNIDAFARFLWNRIVLHDMKHVFVSKRTEQVREASLKGWEEWFVEEFLYSRKNEDIPLNEVKDEVENIFGSRTKPSRKAFNKLRELYPNLFDVIRKKVKKDGKEYRVWHIRT